MKLRTKWPSGATEEYEQSDCATVEDAINTKFGSTWEQAQEAGVTVEEVFELTADDETTQDPVTVPGDGETTQDPV